jgi:four helix bundle protein
LAVQLFKDIYQETETWPRPQVFGLIMDIRRAAMGIPSNLGEGHKQISWQEFSEFLTISQDSLAELKAHLIVAMQNPALSIADLEPLLQQVESLADKLQQLAAGQT